MQNKKEEVIIGDAYPAAFQLPGRANVYGMEGKLSYVMRRLNLTVKGR